MLLKWRRSPQERREKLQPRGTIPRVPQMTQSIPEEPVFPALPRLLRRGLTPTTVARGSALWETSWESHKSLDPRDGKRDTAGTAQEESTRAFPL